MQEFKKKPYKVPEQTEAGKKWWKAVHDRAATSNAIIKKAEKDTAEMEEKKQAGSIAHKKFLADSAKGLPQKEKDSLAENMIRWRQSRKDHGRTDEQIEVEEEALLAKS